MNSQFSDVFGEFWVGILGGVRDYLGEILGGVQRKNGRKIKENYTRNNPTNKNQQINKTLFNDNKSSI